MKNLASPRPGFVQLFPQAEVWAGCRKLGPEYQHSVFSFVLCRLRAFFLITNECTQLLGGRLEGAKEWTVDGNELTQPVASKKNGDLLRGAEGRASHHMYRHE